MVDNDASVVVTSPLVDVSTDSVVVSGSAVLGVFVIALSGTVVPGDSGVVGSALTSDDGVVTSLGFAGVVGTVVEADSEVFSALNLGGSEISADWVVVVVSTVDSEEGVVAIDAVVVMVVVVVVVVVVVGLAVSLLAVSLPAPLGTVALESTFVNPPVSCGC